MKKLLIAGACALAVLPSSASSQTMLDRLIERIGRRKAPAVASADAAAAAPVATFPLDVAGVRLGMSADAARAGMIAAGYQIPANGGTSYGPSFAAQVRAEAEQRRSGSVSTPSMTDRVVTGLTAAGPNRANMSIELTAVPDVGSIVTGVMLEIPSELMDGEAFLKQAVTRYGTPDGQGDLGHTRQWCSPALKAVCGRLMPFGRAPEALPNLVASTLFGRNSLNLKDGTDQDRARAQAYAAAVERAAPKTDRAAF